MTAANARRTGRRRARDLGYRRHLSGRLPVAKVARIERDAAYSLAKITCIPTAGTDQNRQVLVLSQEMNIAARPHGNGIRGGKLPNRSAPKNANERKGKLVAFYEQQAAHPVARQGGLHGAHPGARGCCSTCCPGGASSGARTMVALVLTFWCVHQPARSGSASRGSSGW